MAVLVQTILRCDYCSATIPFQGNQTSHKVRKQAKVSWGWSRGQDTVGLSDVCRVCRSKAQDELVKCLIEVTKG